MNTELLFSAFPAERMNLLVVLFFFYVVFICMAAYAETRTCRRLLSLALGVGAVMSVLIARTLLAAWTAVGGVPGGGAKAFILAFSLIPALSVAAMWVTVFLQEMKKDPPSA